MLSASLLMLLVLEARKSVLGKFSFWLMVKSFV
jgi:hypothetical protein